MSDIRSTVVKTLLSLRRSLFRDIHILCHPVITQCLHPNSHREEMATFGQAARAIGEALLEATTCRRHRTHHAPAAGEASINSPWSTTELTMGHIQTSRESLGLKSCISFRAAHGPGHAL